MTLKATAVAALIGAFVACGAPDDAMHGFSGQATAEQATANPQGAATKAFLDRIQEYVTFHNNVEKMVPPLNETANPEEIAKRELALGEALIKQRPDAKEGDFFIKEYQPYLIKIIRTDFAKRSAADRKALAVELPKDVKVGINMRYPTTLPLLTFPGKLLKALPELPKELEYRIVGRHLILRDVTGNVIVDMLRDVFSIPGRT
jgi:hypothetical protein